MSGFDNMHINIGREMMRTALIVRTTSSANNFSNFVCRDLACGEQIFDIDIAPFCMQNRSAPQTGQYIGFHIPETQITPLLYANIRTYQFE